MDQLIRGYVIEVEFQLVRKRKYAVQSSVAAGRWLGVSGFEQILKSWLGVCLKTKKNKKKKLL